jgi:hypothetical protein
MVPPAEKHMLVEIKRVFLLLRMISRNIAQVFATNPDMTF